MKEQTNRHHSDTLNRYMEITGDLANYFKCLSVSGCSGFDCPDKSIDIVKGWSGKTSPDRVNLFEIQLEVKKCEKCPLAGNRKKTVFGAGDPDARLMFVGEAPGYKENSTGKPFLGPAGDLLTNIIKAMQLTRDSVYICNIVKCMPQEGTGPGPEEIRKCIPYLARQISAINPEYICTLGDTASRALLNSSKSVKELRGKFYKYGNSMILPTHHPADLLKFPEMKRDVWEDMKKLINAAGFDK